MSDKFNRFEPSPELTELLVRSGSHSKEQAVAANAEFAKALEQPLRQGVLNGDVLDGIFEPIQLALLQNFLLISLLRERKRIS